MIRLLIVDDQEIVRQGLGVIFGFCSDVDVAGYAASGQEAIDRALALKPDVILMDLKMPGVNGIEATRRLAQRLPNTRIIALTSYTTDEWVFDAIRAGASGYLLKDNDSKEIVQAVRGAAAGEVYLDPAIAGLVLQEFCRLPTRVSPRSDSEDASREAWPLEPLTDRERTILQELVYGKSNREIAATLGLAEGTVKNYVSNIISKLQSNDRTQAALLALKRGLATLE